MRQPPRVQLGAGFERLDPPGLAIEVLVGAIEKKGDKRADLVAKGGLGGREGWLGDELVVLFVFPASRARVSLWNTGAKGKRGITRTVLRTDDRRGKSCTPVPRVATEDSRKETEVRREATQAA